MKDFIVYSLRKASKLVDMGFEVKRVSININNPKLKVFFFENTEEFRNAFFSLS